MRMSAFHPKLPLGLGEQPVGARDPRERGAIARMGLASAAERPRISDSSRVRRKRVARQITSACDPFTVSGDV